MQLIRKKRTTKNTATKRRATGTVVAFIQSSVVRALLDAELLRSLTGGNTERIHTRVLQAIYRVDDPQIPWYVGQQLDVFAEAV